MGEQRVRGFVVDRNSGEPTAGMPLEFVAEIPVQEDGRDTTRSVSIGILQSDQNGYLSAPLPLPEGATRIVGYPLGGTDREPVVEIDLPEADEPATPLRIPLPPGVTFSGGGRFPEIVEPEAPDLIASPGSFGVADDLLVGEGGCAVLLPSRAPLFSLKFNRILTEPIVDLEQLDHVDASSPCEPQGEFETGGPLCVRRGALIEYEMTWYPIGHALGEVVYSLPLAPCESVDLAVVDWSRDESIARTESTSLTEELLHDLRRDRALEESVNALINEWQEGSSFMGGTAGVGGYQSFITGSHAIGGGNFSSSGSRDVAADGIQRLADGISEATSRVRDLRSTTVVQASQAEQQVVQTRTVTNHNHCHALTVLYFQVVRHFRVRVRLASKRDVIFIKRPPIADLNNHDSVLAYRPVLEPALLDQGLSKCFNALDHERCARLEFETSLTGPWGTESMEVGDLEVRIVTGEDIAYRGMLTLSLVTTWGETIALEPIGLDETRLLRREAGVPRIIGFGDEAGREETFTLQPTRRVRRDVVNGFKVEWGLSRGERGRDSWRLAGLTVRTSEARNGWVLYDERPDILFDAAHLEEVFAPLQPPRPPHAEDMLSADEHCCIAKLLENLQTNSDYYNRVLQLAEDPDTRARWLDRYYFTDGTRRGRLLDFVENRLLGTLGDYVIIPLGTTSTSEKLVPKDPKPEERPIALPGRGLFAEAKLGDCNSCEKRDPSRFWDWAESPCPERPPAIAPVSVDSRARDRATPTPTPVEGALTPEAPPAAPDPGAILSDVMEVLRTSDIFRDMSGREQVAQVLTELVKGAVEVNKAQIQGASAAGKSDGGTGASGDEDSSTGGDSGGSSSRTGGGSSGTSGDGVGTASSSTAHPASAATQMNDRLAVARQAIEQADLPADQRRSLEQQLAEGAVSEATTTAGSGAETSVGFRTDTPVPSETYEFGSRRSWAFALAAMMGWREGRAMSTSETLSRADSMIATPSGEATFQELFDGSQRPMDSPPSAESRFGRLLAGMGLNRRILYPAGADRGQPTASEIERMLREQGPIWVTFTVGAGGSPSGEEIGQGGAASKLLVGISGDGSPEGTTVELISSDRPDTPIRQSLQAFRRALEFEALEGYDRQVYMIQF